MKKKIRSYMDLALAMFISGSAVVVNKMMVSTLPAFLATELGILIGLFILIPYTFLIQRCKWSFDLRTNLVLLAQAFCGVFLYRIFTFVGLKSATAVSSGLITSAAPMLVLIFARIILKEKISFKQVVAIILTVLGLFINNLSNCTFAEGNGFTGGNFLIMAAVICEAMFSILSKVRCKPLSAICRTTIIMTDAFILLLPAAIYDAVRYDFSKMDLKSLFCVTYYGVFVTFLSYILWFRGIENTKAANAAVFTSVVPISSMLLSVILLHETLLLLHMISLILILTGIGISCLAKHNITS